MMVLPQAPPVDDIVNERYSDTVYRFLFFGSDTSDTVALTAHVDTEQDLDTSFPIHHLAADTL